MKQYEEIKRILTHDLGWTDLAAYRRWIEEARPSVRPTRERIELLSPDHVDCRDFWRACDELFGFDPVCNVAVAPEFGELPYRVETRMDANRLNLRLAKSLGITAFLDEHAHARVKTFEIGVGYGSIKNYIESNTEHLYLGVDVVPRIPGVIEATAEGLIPREIIAAERDQIAYVIATNVFQHLSARQRTQYWQDAATLLRPGGILLFNLLVDTSRLPASARDDHGQAWCDHYGQFTAIPKAGPLYDEICASFDILYVTQRYDGIFNFVCRKTGDTRERPDS